MNPVRLKITKQPLVSLRLLCNFQNLQRLIPNSNYYATSVDIDAYTTDLLKRHICKRNPFDISKLSVQHFVNENQRDVSIMSQEEIDDVLQEFISKNQDKHIEQLVLECYNARKFIKENTLKKMFRNYSISGKPDMVIVLQNYCAKVDPYLYKRNGEFLHYLAKAQCMKGNSEKGLSILKACYQKNENLRSFYRIIFRELIQDSVLNRSEASLVTFKKYVLKFSSTWNDHYPLICFWHICWASTWFSDQMLANELLENSEVLRDIVQSKATAFSITALREEYNDDAVMRLLQTLLKYNMMTEYEKVLQILFHYKLRNRDIRGCTEIIRNCEALGLALSSDQQGKYIKLLIEGKVDTKPSNVKPTSKNFKLKF